MLEVTNGQTQRPQVAEQLERALTDLQVDGSLYIGYPVLATADDIVTVDALLVTQDFGLVAFKFEDVTPNPGDDDAWTKAQAALDKLYVALEFNLSRNDSLIRGRHLAVKPKTIALFPALEQPVEKDDATFSSIGSLVGVIKQLPPLEDGIYRPLQAALQRVATIKPKKKREKAVSPASRGTILKKIEQEIANLDQWQKQAAIETPAGPQRIRGLAGSGKTIVLALKAAYLHIQNPDWTIAVAFQTRSLYQQIEDLIRRFCYEQTNDEPDWDRIRVRHAWGGREREGIYTELAAYSGVTPQPFNYGRMRYGRERAFEGLCEELLSSVSNDDVTPLYDAILIDEAQDLPPSFFKLVYRFTKDPKRVIWAYDELQKISETSMPSLEELFGTNQNGQPVVDLSGVDNAKQDIVLKLCYRNPPWTLTAAHAVGFGIYGEAGLVQHFDEPSLWLDIGYQVAGGVLAPGEDVILRRAPESFPAYFNDLLAPPDVIENHEFKSQVEQAAWIANSIRRNLEEDELDHDDILIVLPSTSTAEKDSKPIRDALRRFGIDSHVAGVTSSRDYLFRPKSIAMAQIHRSKGNEAAMVYIPDAQQCIDPYRQVTMRNTLFTAITRSRAWVRVCGYGTGMSKIRAELEKVAAAGYALEFSVPTPDELSKIRQIHRERSATERQRIRQSEDSLRATLRSIEHGDLDLEDISSELRTTWLRLLSRGDSMEEDDSESS